jgi:hypothetical protein
VIELPFSTQATLETSAFTALSRIAERSRHATKRAAIDRIQRECAEWISRLESEVPEGPFRRETWRELRQCFSLWSAACEANRPEGRTEAAP